MYRILEVYDYVTTQFLIYGSLPFPARLK